MLHVYVFNMLPLLYCCDLIVYERLKKTLHRDHIFSVGSSLCPWNTVNQLNHRCLIKLQFCERYTYMASSFSNPPEGGGQLPRLHPSGRLCVEYVCNMRQIKAKLARQATRRYKAQLTDFKTYRFALFTSWRRLYDTYSRRRIVCACSCSCLTVSTHPVIDAHALRC